MNNKEAIIWISIVAIIALGSVWMVAANSNFNEYPDDDKFDEAWMKDSVKPVKLLAGYFTYSGKYTVVFVDANGSTRVFVDKPLATAVFISHKIGDEIIPKKAE